ncbi:hypothetical protein D3C74_215010 [compost metagenome]
MKTKITKNEKEILMADSLAIIENSVDKYSVELDYYKIIFDGLEFKAKVNRKGILIEMEQCKDHLGYEHRIDPSQITNKQIIQAGTPKELSNLILDELNNTFQSLGMHINGFYKHLRRENYIVDGINIEYNQNKYCVSVFFDDEDGKYRLIDVEIYNIISSNWECKEVLELDLEVHTHLTDNANELISFQQYSV